MPLYSLRSRTGKGFDSVSEIGFYRDEGAVAYARRTAGTCTIEVWRDEELIAVVDRARPAEAMVNAPVQA